jgi:RNA polymerase sigma factor (sigma-70 family)
MLHPTIQPTDGQITGTGPADSTGDLLERALRSDASAWETLVAEHQDHLMRIASSYRLGHETHDVVQTAWVRLLEHGGGIRDRTAVRAWLSMVVRRECLRILRSRRREEVGRGDDVGQLVDLADPGPTAEDLVLRAEERELMRRAVQTLPRRQQVVLDVLNGSGAPDYATVSQQLGMPVGSIGPTRQRGLRRLRTTLTDMGMEMCG